MSNNKENTLAKVNVVLSHMEELCNNLETGKKVMVTKYYEGLAKELGLKFEEVRTLGSMYVKGRSDIQVKPGPHGGMEKIHNPFSEEAKEAAFAQHLKEVVEVAEESPATIQEPPVTEKP